MTNAFTTLINRLNRLGRTREHLELMLKSENERYKKEQETGRIRHSRRLATITARIEKTDPEIWNGIAARRDELIPKDKKSFVTSERRFQFKAVPFRQKVTDANAVMALARKLGIVTPISDPPSRRRIFNSTKFFEYLESHGELRERFEEWIDETGGGDEETLHMSPNADYTTFYDGERLSPPSITIKSPPREE